MAQPFNDDPFTEILQELDKLDQRLKADEEKAETLRFGDDVIVTIGGKRHRYRYVGFSKASGSQPMMAMVTAPGRHFSLRVRISDIERAPEPSHSFHLVVLTAILFVIGAIAVWLLKN